MSITYFKYIDDYDILDKYGIELEFRFMEPESGDKVGDRCIRTRVTKLFGKVMPSSLFFSKKEMSDINVAMIDATSELIDKMNMVEFSDSSFRLDISHPYTTRIMFTVKDYGDKLMSIDISGNKKTFSIVYNPKIDTLKVYDELSTIEVDYIEDKIIRLHKFSTPMSVSRNSYSFETGM